MFLANHTGSKVFSEALIYTYVATNVWLNVLKEAATQSEAFCSHQQNSGINLAEYLTLLGRTGGIHLNGSVSWTELAFKHSPQIFHSVEVGALGRPFQQAVLSVPKQVLMLEHSLVSRFQSPPMAMTLMSMMSACKLFLDQWQT